MREELKDTEKMEDVDIFVGEVEEQELPEVIEENGLIRAEYMWEHKAHEYRMMLQDGTRNRYLHEVDEECHREVEQAVRRIMEKEGVDERLKAENPLEWVRRVNGIKMCVEAEVERRLQINVITENL